jgi:hypothetical protein
VSGTSAAPRDAQLVGTVGVPVEQANDRAHAVGGAQLEAVAGRQADVEHLLVGGAVDELDHGVGLGGIGGAILAPAIDRVHDACEVAVAADAVVRAFADRPQATRVLPAADVVGQAVVVGDPQPSSGA